MVPLKKSFLEKLSLLRREIHRHPELAYQEEKTAHIVERELKKLHIPYEKGFAGTGIRAEIIGREKGSGDTFPCVALRADMDALPIQETTGRSFSSAREGIMHACGHDGHTSMLLGAAELLHQGDFCGKVVLLFQPAEESGNGAAKMVEDKAIDGVDMIFAGHIDTHFPVGYITVDPGLICSFTDPFTITIHGRGGHAARPHETIDSVVVAANLVMSMQTLVSRQINPSHAAVVTVGRLSAGAVHNVIAEEAILDGTIRSAHLETRKSIRSGLERLIQGTREMSNAEIEITYFEGLPAVINDEMAASIARKAAVTVVSEQLVGSQLTPSLGGEDFAFYQQVIPGCLVRFGAQTEGDIAGPAHSGRYDFDEAVLGHGACWLAQVARDGLLYFAPKSE